MKKLKIFNAFVITMLAAVMFVTGCKDDVSFGKKAIPLILEDVDEPNNPGGPVVTPVTPVDPPAQPGDPITLKPVDGYNAIFSAPLGTSIPGFAMGVVDADPTGLRVMDDWDGDGVPNDLEVMSSPYVADYPRIVTRISTPIVMELRRSETRTEENYTENIENTDTKQTMTKSMENKHYAMMNERTTPYVTKESQSTDDADAYSYGDAKSTEVATSVKFGIPCGTNVACENEASVSTKQSQNQNWSISNKFAQSTMSEKTVFEDVDYVDNLDRNAVEMKDEKIQIMSTNFRKSEKTKETYEIGPEAGVVSAGLYIKNDTVNMPVRISNVKVSLTFRTAGGAVRHVITKLLRLDDYSLFDEEVCGGEELGPYTVKFEGLNTYMVKEAMRNGYMPQITVVSYDMTRVDDSIYNPGVDNLKMVEDAAKARTALIKIIGTNTREIYRVAAFDVDETTNTVSPGISLKKALFRIYADKIGRGEQWTTDMKHNILTVPDTGLKWKENFLPDAVKPGEYAYSENKLGNEWRLFQTYVKPSTDEYNQPRRIESIKRIGTLKAYNPFDNVDNTSYNPNEFLEKEELMNMKYWIILHNGRYFTGDINDPIWAGERYEIICMDIRDFNEYFKTFSYSPVQSQEYFRMNTSWNALNNEGEFARARYLGRIVKSDVVHLEINLNESRFLFDGLGGEGKPVGAFNTVDLGGNESAREWYRFNYTLQDGEKTPQGIPAPFSHYAEGGFNNIKVTINESKNAKEYEIYFKENSNAAIDWKKVVVSANELKFNNNEVFITSEARDFTSGTSGTDGRYGKIGFIPGRLLSAGGLEYIVTVTAIGEQYGVRVPTLSMTNTEAEAVTVVYNLAASSVPGGNYGFTFSAAGLADNWVYVRIADADYTEYFKIVVLGPYNYPHAGNNPPLDDQTAPSREFTAHRGLNRIQLQNPPGDVKEDGLYKIQVFGYNHNCVQGVMPARLAKNEYQYIKLAHDRYAAQRIYKPRLSTELFKMNALDLEVNFNDGAGWYRLKLDPGDTCITDDIGPKMIDCRFNSYVEYDSQKFHIFFKPPCGVYDDYSKNFAGNHDVFAGGREEVDIYLRTVSEPRYRDTFWLRDQGSTVFDEMLNYLVTPSSVLPLFATDDSLAYFADYWINSDGPNQSLTDASNIENTLSSNGISSGSFFSDNMGIGIKGVDMSNFFFSPVEFRKFDVRASLVEKLPQQQNYVVDVPSFSASGGPSCIIVNNIQSQFATYYEVYYKLINPNHDPNDFLIAPDENPLNWDTVRVDMNNPYYVNSIGLGRVTIPKITPEQRYVIAVIGYNMYGRSEPAYFDGHDGTVAKTGDTDNRGNIIPVYVYSGIAPTVAPSINVALDPQDETQRQILVSNVYTEGAVRYIIEWKESQDGWDSASRYDTFSSGQITNGAVEFRIIDHHGRSLFGWKRYNIRVCAATLNDVYGPWGSSTDGTSIITGTTVHWGSPEYAWSNYHPENGNWYTDLVIRNINFPEGTVYFEIDGNLSCHWNRMSPANPYDSDIPISVDNTLVLLGEWEVLLITGGFYRTTAETLTGSVTITAYNEDRSLSEEFTLATPDGGFLKPEDAW